MIGKLSRLAPLGGTRLEAPLRGVAGFTGSGVVRYAAHANGRRRIDADLKGLAGLKAEIVAGAAPLGALPCRAGSASARFDSAQGAAIPALQPGDTIEIRQNGVAVLRGVFAPA
jgi:hypothetical protein